MATPPNDQSDASGEEGPEGEASGTAKALDAAAAQLTGVRRALTIQDDDSVWVGAVKIVGMIVVAVLLLGLSPLIILGLVVGLAAAA